MNHGHNDSDLEDKLSDLERTLLRSKGVDEDEMDALERFIRSEELCEHDQAILSHLPGSPLYALRPDEEDSSPDVFEQQAEELLNDRFVDAVHPGLVTAWKEHGLEGVIKLEPFRFVDVSNTFYTFLSWRGIRPVCERLELTPLPSADEVDRACGQAGLKLPSIFFSCTRYFDFEFLTAADERKLQRSREYAQIRFEVASCLIGCLADG